VPCYPIAMGQIINLRNNTIVTTTATKPTTTTKTMTTTNDNTGCFIKKQPLHIFIISHSDVDEF